ncbi:microtubule-associated tumor suppressor 1 homolog A [Neosynchiropus ocellatus]
MDQRDQRIKACPPVVMKFYNDCKQGSGLDSPKMTSDVSAEAQADTVTREDLKLGHFPRDHYSDLSLSPSPDSTSSILIQSDQESMISPDFSVQLSSHGESSPLDNQLMSRLPDNVFCDSHSNLNQSFFSTPTGGTVGCWNANLCQVFDRGVSADALNQNTFGSPSSAVTYPDITEQGSEPGSCTSSRKASAENHCSSGEMIIRTNSFCLADQSLPAMSSLEESLLSPLEGLQVLPEDSKMLSDILPQQSDPKDADFLGVTFIQEQNWGPQTENRDTSSDNNLVVMPSEDEGCLQRTFFVSDTISANGNETPSAHGAVSPEQVKTFVSTAEATKDAENCIHTSTPVQNLGNQINDLPCFSESPCIGQQKNLRSAPNHLWQTSKPGLESGDAKGKETKKTNISKLKSKVLVKPTQRAAVATPAAKHKPMSVSATSRNSETSRGKITRSSSKLAGVSDPPRQMNTGPGRTITGPTVSTDEAESSVALNECASSEQCVPAGSEAQQAATIQDPDSPALGPGNQTFCLSALEKSSDRSSQMEPKPNSKKSVLDRIKARQGSATGQDRPPVLKMRPRGSSESSLLSRSTKEKKPQRLPGTFSFSKKDTHKSWAKAGPVTSKAAAAHRESVEKSGLSPSVSGRENLSVKSCQDPETPVERSKGSPRPPKRTPASQPPLAPPKPTPLSTRLRIATKVKSESTSSKPLSTLHAKPKSGAGIQKPSGESSQRVPSTSLKPAVHGLRNPQTPASRATMSSATTSGSKLPHSGLRLRRNDQMEGACGAGVSGGATPKQTFRVMRNVFLRTKIIPTPAETTRGPTLSTTCKSVASARKGLCNPAETPQKRTSTAKLVRLALSKPVDKKTAKTGSRQQQACPNRPPDVVPLELAEYERKETRIDRLKEALAARNRGFEAITVVLKNTLTERDEATRQYREQSQELVDLRGELVSSVHSAERLQKEKDDVQRSLESALHTLQEQHQKDLEEVEKRLQTFYQAEWDKVHLTYQEEADKCKARMQEQLEELQAHHEAMKEELERSHSHQLTCVKQQYETSLEELRKFHSQELESLGRTVKEAEAALTVQIQQLTEENKVLQEKLSAEESRRRALAERSQKDSRTVYLEQELESLKVVLDIKNKQLHQQEKKLMEIDSLTEKNVKLDESLKKVQQENEDLKARMERHAALSKQLSTEQAVLQQSLQMESKVNKRLSMENEELLWKLNNGDPHRVSPSSPSHSFSLQSPCRSNIFSSPSVSPR